MSLLNIIRQQGVPSASHNIYAHRFKNSDGITHEGSEDDGEVGAGRSLLGTLTENDIQNTVVVVARWFGSIIGARGFSHIKNSGMSAVKGLLVRYIRTDGHDRLFSCYKPSGKLLLYLVI